MPKEATPQEMFEYVGKALCAGESYWEGTVSELTGIRRETNRALRSGHLGLGQEHFETLLRVRNPASVGVQRERSEIWNR